MAMSAQIELGTSSGWRSPTGWRCSVLFCWQTAHPCTKSRTSRLA
uniref:Uncharacterized protein n=1 Tax=Arundo donax TaxID=35708 RepID=A0A0A9BU23_ARUDO